jgi:glycosyltransferase involved in cell wall biosynthesis
MVNPPPRLQVADVEGADVIISQRVNAYEGLGLWRRWNTPWTRTVYENDDDIFNITHENVAAYDSYKEGTELREAVKRYCDTASLITVSTPHLGDMHREMSPGVPVEVLPNYIPKLALDLPHDDRQGRLRIGWMGGASHVRDVEEAAASVRRFMQRHQDWDMVVAGADYRRSFRVDKRRLFYVPWLHVTNDPKLFYRMIDYDIGICPLLDTQFARSKSPIKALEYSARGIPVIASNVEPYRNFIHDGVDGFLVKHPHEWLNRLELLANDEDLRLKMGAAAIENARKHLIEDHWQEWVNAYKMLFPVGWDYQG